LNKGFFILHLVSKVVKRTGKPDLDCLPGILQGNPTPSDSHDQFGRRLATLLPKFLHLPKTAFYNDLATKLEAGRILKGFETERQTNNEEERYKSNSRV
jgi:hypothetical protein